LTSLEVGSLISPGSALSVGLSYPGFLIRLSDNWSHVATVHYICRC